MLPISTVFACCTRSATRLTRLTRQLEHTYVQTRNYSQPRTAKPPSNSTLRVPQPVFDNAAFTRRAFKGKSLTLVSLSPNHAPDLWAASGKGSKEIGEFLPNKFPSTPLQFNYYIRDLSMLNDDPYSRSVAFCIQNSLDRDTPIGIVTIRDISALNKTMEIGFTWIGKEFWGSHVNLEAIYIIMEEAFEYMGVNRVSFKVSTSDARYSHILEDIGAKKEGVLRSFQLGMDDQAQDVISYSILQAEWAEVKAHIRTKIVSKLRDQTEAAKEKLKAEGLLEPYEQQREAKLKVDNIKKERSHKQPVPEDEDVIENYESMERDMDAANEMVEQGLTKSGGRTIKQKKRRSVKKT